MRRIRPLATIVLAITLFGALVAVADADPYVLGIVENLIHIEGQGYFVEIQTTSDRNTVEVSEDLWNQLDIGDTMKLSGETWSLLRKGPI